MKHVALQLRSHHLLWGPGSHGQATSHHEDPLLAPDGFLARLDSPLGAPAGSRFQLDTPTIQNNSS